MTSLEIAELTGKRHDHVRSDIKRIAEKLGVSIISEDDLALSQTPGDAIVEKRAAKPGRPPMQLSI